MSVEQILLRSMYYFRSIFQRSNYCRRSKCHTFGMFGAYFSEAIVGGAIDTRANVAGAIIGGAIVGGAIVGGANVVSPEHLSPEQLSTEQLSAEQMSAEQMSPEQLWAEQLSPEQMSAEQMSPEQMSRSICRGAFVTFFGAIVDGAYVAGAYVVSPEEEDEGVEEGCHRSLHPFHSKFCSRINQDYRRIWNWIFLLVVDLFIFRTQFIIHHKPVPAVGWREEEDEGVEEGCHRSLHPLPL